MTYVLIVGFSVKSPLTFLFRFLSPFFLLSISPAHGIQKNFIFSLFLNCWSFCCQSLFRPSPPFSFPNPKTCLFLSSTFFSQNPNHKREPYSSFFYDTPTTLTSSTFSFYLANLRRKLHARSWIVNLFSGKPPNRQQKTCWHVKPRWYASWRFYEALLKYLEIITIGTKSTFIKERRFDGIHVDQSWNVCSPHGYIIKKVYLMFVIHILNLVALIRCIWSLLCFLICWMVFQ